jgi:hypothetical protein
MKTKEFLKQHSACIEGAKWALSISEDMADVWDAMLSHEKWEWLIWTLSRPGVFPESVLRKMACKFIRQTPLSDGRTVWDMLTDERSRKAVEVAEAYADGKATDEELHAARASAYAAYVAAHSSAYVAARAARAAYVARAASVAADAAAYTAADAAADAAYAACDADAYAKAAQIKMISEIWNPFREERVGR